MTSPTGRLAHSSSPASSRSKSAAASGWSPRSSTNDRPTRSEEAEVAAVGVVQQGGADEQVEASPVGPPAAPLDLEGRLGALGGRGPAQVGQDRVVPGLGQVADGVLSSSSASERPRSSHRARLTRRKRPSSPTSAIPIAAWSKPRPRSISPPLPSP